MVLSSLLMWIESGWSSTLKPVAEPPAFAGKMDHITTKVLSNPVQKLSFQVAARRATPTGVTLKGSKSRN